MPELLVDAPAQPIHKPHRFTAANAAEYARKSHAPDSARYRKPIAELPPAVAVQPAVSADDFVSRKLVRVRQQIDAVEALLADVTEPQAVDRFCNALTRLYDVERILAGRPLPGSRRPAQERGSRGSMIELRPVLADEPQVAQVQAMAPAQPAKPMGWEYEDTTPVIEQPNTPASGPVVSP